SYGASQRMREFGLRVALGATSGSLRRLVLTHALGLTSLGVGLGLMGAAWLTRLLEEQLFDVAPADPLTLAMVALVLAAVALGASYLPARRACRIDPMQALRME